MPRLVGHGLPKWQVSNISATERLQEETKFQICQLGRTYAGSFQKTPNFGPQIVPSSVLQLYVVCSTAHVHGVNRKNVKWAVRGRAALSLGENPGAKRPGSITIRDLCVVVAQDLRVA
eukprot:639110-Pelagomonas_calceolata.AAC.1